MSNVLDFYPIIRVKRLGNIILMQPWWQGKKVDGCLSCDLSTGSLSFVEEDVTNSYTEVFGVVGMIKTKTSSAVVFVTDAKEVAIIRGFPVFLITKTSVMYSSSGVSKGDRKVINSLEASVNPDKYGSGMYICAGSDLSLSYQKQEDADQTHSAWQRADPWLTWNRALALPIIEAGAEKFVPTIVKGFIEQVKNVQFSQNQTINLTVIARRSAKRPGTRQWRRGTDVEAHVANFVESEQIVEFEDGCISSFVQVRGSIPIMWSQTPNLMYKIPILIGPSGRSEAVLKSHVSTLCKNYGGVTAISLANLTGREGKLSNAYQSAAAAVSKEVSGFKFVAFDFHKECGAVNYHNLSKLWNSIQGEHASYGAWSRGGKQGNSRQSGVFRTNCIDTLDRTNVVQGLLARKTLEQLLCERGLLNPGETFEKVNASFETLFRSIWADHGDEISRQYAGTGAMKSAFTRTGKRDFSGLMDDGIKSLTRYYLNNFRDGGKQDALDLVTGTFKPERDGISTPTLGGMSPATLLIIAAALFRFAYTSMQNMSALPDALTIEALKQMWLPLFLALGILQIIKKFGKYFVDTPTFRPDLSVPWENKN